MNPARPMAARLTIFFVMKDQNGFVKKINNNNNILPKYKSAVIINIRIRKQFKFKQQLVSKDILSVFDSSEFSVEISFEKGGIRNAKERICRPLVQKKQTLFASRSTYRYANNK